MPVVIILTRAFVVFAAVVTILLGLKPGGARVLPAGVVAICRSLVIWTRVGWALTFRYTNAFLIPIRSWFTKTAGLEAIFTDGGTCAVHE